MFFRGAGTLIMRCLSIIDCFIRVESNYALNNNVLKIAAHCDLKWTMICCYISLAEHLSTYEPGLINGHVF